MYHPILQLPLVLIHTLPLERAQRDERVEIDLASSSLDEFRSEGEGQTLRECRVMFVIVAKVLLVKQFGVVDNHNDIDDLVWSVYVVISLLKDSRSVTKRMLDMFDRKVKFY